MKDRHLSYLMKDRTLTLARMATLMECSEKEVGIRIQHLYNNPIVNLRAEQWPPTEDKWFIICRFEDVDAATLAAERKRNPGVIYAKRDGYGEYRSHIASQFSSFTK